MTTNKNTAQAIAAHAFSLTVYQGGVSKFIQLAKTEEASALGMTKKAFGELAYSMSSIRQARTKAHAEAKLRPTVGVAMKQRIERRLSLRLGAGFTYRQPTSGWVDVSNEIAVVLTTSGQESKFTVRETIVRHPKHWQWKANETRHTLDLCPSDDFTTVGGLLTTFRKADRHLSAIPCTWYEQSRGFEVKAVSGFLCGDYHIQAETAEAALAKAKARDKRTTAQIQMQQDLAAQRDETRLEAGQVHRVFGFCMAGIRNFCEANGLDPQKTYTLRQIREVVVANRTLNCRAYSSYLHKLGITLGC